MTSFARFARTVAAGAFAALCSSAFAQGVVTDDSARKPGTEGGVGTAGASTAASATTAVPPASSGTGGDTSRERAKRPGPGSNAPARRPEATSGASPG
ncbi:hypothetical protein B0G57_10893 [Trinickia symbiotica]|uniref:Uncharacterized protein n=1 Tax=Trinickia symbiotica TaxID=863227 RepID=A0A2N7X2Y9_9BURK|nr:hypothetical protein C0Z20_16080 [Trinickia symbiotica]PPK44513.1 hypothetical protein B0G57_10893 [Trinickia symbiotica]